MGFVLIYDIPRILSVERVRINRDLHRMNAERIQDSVWKHENLSELIKIGIKIREIGGRAEILEEKFLF